jgi:hypothetical protein
MNGIAEAADAADAGNAGNIGEMAPLRRGERTGSRLQQRIAAGLIAAGGIAALAGLWLNAARTWTDLLLGAFYLLSLALAGLVFVAIQYLASAGWWTAIRRVPEALASLLPIAAVPMLALWFGRHTLYAWSRPGAAAHDAVLAAKAAYLNVPFFFGRMLLFLTLWSLFAISLRRISLAQDRADSLACHRRLVRLSAVFIVLFAVSFSLASFDWLMSLEPHWASTIFAVYSFAGLFLAGLAAITLCVVLLSSGGPLTGAVNASHRHDLGKLLFAFSTFWAYIWVCQYLLIWYGNLSDEIPYYIARTRGGWLALFLLNPLLNWLIPFVVLLPRKAKRNPVVLRWVAGIILLGRWLDLYLLVAPAVLPRPRIGPLEVLITLGFAGIAVYAGSRALRRAPLLTRGDPFLAESLAHHQ